MTLTRSTLAALALATLAACGGGGDPATPAAGGGNANANPNAALTCNTNAYVAGAVALPTSAQLTAYAGTYDGDEGNFGPNIGDPFVKSGTATFVLRADGTATYQGAALDVKSLCVDKAVNGAGGTFLYVLGDTWSIDVTDTGTAFGGAPPNGAVLFENGKRR